MKSRELLVVTYAGDCDLEVGLCRLLSHLLLMGTVRMKVATQKYGGRKCSLVVTRRRN